MIYIIMTYLLISQTLIMHVSTEFNQKLTLPERSLKKTKQNHKCSNYNRKQKF